MLSQKIILGATGVLLTLGLSGCNSLSDSWISADKFVPYFLKPYRADVHQGNLITSDMINQLEVGMTAPQVQFLLGVPLLQDQFHRQRWDYVYFLMRGDGQQSIRKLSIEFNNEGRVESWHSDPMPTEEQADQLILGNIKTFEPVKQHDSNAKDSAVPAKETEPTK